LDTKSKQYTNIKSELDSIREQKTNLDLENKSRLLDIEIKNKEIQDNKDIIAKLEYKITEQDNLINQLDSNTNTNSNSNSKKSSIEEISKIDVLEKKVDELQNMLVSNQNGYKKNNRKKNNNYQEQNYYLMDPNNYTYNYTNPDMLYRNINGQLYAVGYAYPN
jgi:hypothetical protein